MSVTFRVASTPAPQADADLLAVPVFAERVLGPGAEALNRALGEGLPAFMEEAGFEGKVGETLAVPTAGALGARAALLVGLGPADEVTVDGIRDAAAAIARKASKVSERGDHARRRRARRCRSCRGGASAGGRSPARGLPVPRVQVGSDAVEAGRGHRARARRCRRHAALERGAAVATAVIWARDAVNLPAGEQPPAAFAESAQKLLRGKGVKVEVLDVAAMRKEKLGGVLGVGQGSEQPPRLVRMTYSPPGARGTVALVGKGVVFDSGGLSLKTAGGMETMKTDMSGAATVIATMSALKDLGVKTKVIALTPMVENMPSGSAIRPGDVLKMRNGKTVEVLNTDAEGRLILADALSLAAEAEPDAIIDLATLTGACVVALGEKIAGLISNNEAWGEQVRDAADRAGERVWPLPLPPEYRKQLDSEVADLKNIGGGGYGGALTAGLFLEAFVDERPWVHLDIAGPARASADDGYIVRGGTGFGVRTLLELLARYKRPAGSRTR